MIFFTFVNTFFGTGISLLWGKNTKFFQSVPASRQATSLFLEELLGCALVCDSFLKRVAFGSNLFMRAWLAGLILAIFGLWLALI